MPLLPDLADVVRALDEAVPLLTVSTQGGPHTTWVSDVVARSRAGADPLGPWRRALAVRQGSEHRPHVAAAFVLQWWCEVVATPIAYAAELGPWVLEPSPGGLGFELAPGLFPNRVVLRPEAVAVREPADRSAQVALEAGWAAYESLVRDVARTYAPEVKMSSRQRWGVVGDVWRTAVCNARGGGATVQRVSCCFIVALPGMQACAGCPRRGGSRTGPTDRHDRDR